MLAGEYAFRGKVRERAAWILGCSLDANRRGIGPARMKIVSLQNSVARACATWWPGPWTKLAKDWVAPSYLLHDRQTCGPGAYVSDYNAGKTIPGTSGKV